MKKITVLSENERQFADKHHDTVLHFLSHFHLKMADYYDVVIFGYLSAVQIFLRFRVICLIPNFRSIVFLRLHGAG